MASGHLLDESILLVTQRYIEQSKRGMGTQNKSLRLLSIACEILLCSLILSFSKQIFFLAGQTDTLQSQGHVSQLYKQKKCN